MLKILQARLQQYVNRELPRILMIGTLTGLQWWIYDTWKTFCGYPSSGGH